MKERFNKYLTKIGISVLYAKPNKITPLCPQSTRNVKYETITLKTKLV